jgi:riboflavin kinase/FMN adenylyltransferase
VIVLRSLENVPESLRRGAVAIGNFDGVHLGHARLVERLKVMADAVGGPAVVFTFDPPPARLLRPEAAPEPLIWIDRKIEILAELGADAVLIYPTDRAFLELEARTFFDLVVRDRLAAQAMVEGPNFFFGHNRSGNVEVLRTFCEEAGIRFEVAQPVAVGGQIVSSSRIRGLVSAGQVAEAQRMLGRLYRIRGVVAHGEGRGTGLGYPTANVGRIVNLLPGEGVYAARAYVENAWHPAAVSVGPNLTFDEGERKIEVYLIAYQGTALYDRPIEVDFIARLRDIKRFDSVELLIAQMGRDVTKTLEIAS